MHQTSSTYSAWENVVSHMFTPKETGSKLGLKPLARWNRDRTQANSRLKSHQVYADSNGILWPGMLTRHLLSFEPFFLKLDTWWRVISFSLVDELVCFNEHNETSKENEKHRVPSWQWYFKGTVCSESCAGTYLTNKSCPSPSESVSPVSPVRRNRECRRFPTRVGSVSAVCGMLSLRVSMQVDGRCATDGTQDVIFLP